MAEWETTLNRKTEDGKSWEKVASRAALIWQLQSESVSNSSPNPSRVPLNYIDNLDSRKKAQKEYEGEVKKNQHEIACILWEMEDKASELDSVRDHLCDKKNELNDVSGQIMEQIYAHQDFFFEILNRILEKLSENLEENEWAEWDEWQEIEAWDDNEVQEDSWDGADEQQVVEWDNGGESGNNLLFWEKIEAIQNMFNQMWYQLTLLNDDPSEADEEPERNALDFYFWMTDPANRPQLKQYLSDAEIDGIENLIDKELITKWKILQYQLWFSEKLMNALQLEYNDLDKKYSSAVSKRSALDENMEKTNEKYFLDSYQSTKNVTMDSFISNPVVKKQIDNLIQLNKKWLPLPKTILLYGGHNLWKTYAANVLANELGRKMYHIKSSDIFTWWYTDPNAMLDTIFEWAVSKKEPCIIFLDEMEEFNVDNSDWSAYKKLVSNTIRHHISKIKESSLDIMIIWAVADKSKVDGDLLKQEVFSKMVLFMPLWKEESLKLLDQFIKNKWMKLADDVDLWKVLENTKKDKYTPESLKRFIEVVKSLHELDDDAVFTMDDFEQARAYITQTEHMMSNWIWYNW